MLKVLYVFSGDRKNRFIGNPGVDFPDTQFYGMNHLKESGIHAEYKEFEAYPFGKALRKIFGFRFKHVLMFFPALKYDLVFGISVLYMLIWKKIIPTKTKFVIFNSNLNRMISVHKPNTIAFKLLRSLLREVDGIVFLSEDHRMRVVEKFPFLKHKSHVVLMGVDKLFFKPTYEGRENFLLSVGRDNARDYATIVEVARRLPHEEFRFVCLSRNLVGIKEIPQNVKIYENISLHELDALYRNAKALLLIMHNDSYTEGSDSSGPTVLLEAMASGLPIVVSKKSYVSEYLEDAVDALLVDFYDVDAIVESISTLAKPEVRMEFAKNARAKVDERFNTVTMAHELAHVFKKIHGSSK